MKKAAKAFLIIELILACMATVLALYFRGTPFKLWYLFLIGGAYAFAGSMGGLMALKKGTKKSLVLWGALNLPVLFPTSVIMFLIKEETKTEKDDEFV